nr:hypothetical protein [Candidatus Magnetococcus massalia]CRH08300.1 protein of unknown function [Candidatus Magnetococcus massalia]
MKNFVIPKQKGEWIQHDINLKPKRYGNRAVVAGMATMPSRFHTFRLAFLSIVRQVDHLYLYLDGFDETPDLGALQKRVTVTHSADMPGYHANGKLLGVNQVQQECTYLCIDDDIYFPYDFAARMAQALSQHNDQAVIGLHGAILNHPMTRYYEDKKGVCHYSSILEKETSVDVIGTGAAAFSTATLSFDLEQWPKVSMTDLGVAIAAAKANIPMLCIAREHPMVINLEECQQDSLFVARNRDDRLQTQLGQELIRIRQQAVSPSRVSPQ